MTTSCLANEYSKKTDKLHLKAISFPGINEIKKLITEKGCRNSLFSRFIIYALYFYV
jgi:hypothetical protein